MANGRALTKLVSCLKNCSIKYILDIVKHRPNDPNLTMSRVSLKYYYVNVTKIIVNTINFIQFKSVCRIVSFPKRKSTKLFRVRTKDKSP